jgi:hypothetical protein
MKKVAAFVVVLGFASMAFAGPGTPYIQKAWNDRAERGLVQKGGSGQAGLTFDGAMNKGGDTFKPGILALNGAYAPMDNLEVGLWFPLQLLKPEGAKILNSIGPIYAEYQFLDFLAARLAFDLPLEPKFDAKFIQFYLDFLAKYKLADNFALIGSLGFNANFGFDKGYKSIPLFVGAQYTFIPDFWGQLLTGINYNLEGMDASSIPILIKLGYTLAGNMDVGLNFALNNLNPPIGGAIDSKSFGVFFSYLF